MSSVEIILFSLFFSLFVLPVVVYLCLKFGTAAYYKAKQMFKDKH